MSNLGIKTNVRFRKEITMSYSSLFGIKKDYTGECICDFKNSWLFSPIVMAILPDKYIPQFIKTPFGFKKSIISDMSGEVFNKTNERVNNCKNTADRVCWELANQQIFSTKDKQIVFDSIHKFIEQNKAYNKSDEDGISSLEREHIIERFNEIADEILGLDEDEYPYFVFKNTSVDDEVERWFFKEDENGEYVEASLKENIDNFCAEFVVIENGEIKGFVSNKEFDYS